MKMRKLSQIKKRCATFLITFFVNVAKDIGNDDSSQYNQDFTNHPSIEKIVENNPPNDIKDQFTLNLLLRHMFTRLFLI